MRHARRVPWKRKLGSTEPSLEKTSTLETALGYGSRENILSRSVFHVCDETLEPVAHVRRVAVGEATKGRIVAGGSDGVYCLELGARFWMVPVAFKQILDWSLSTHLLVQNFASRTDLVVILSRVKSIQSLSTGLARRIKRDPTREARRTYNGVQRRPC